MSSGRDLLGWVGGASGALAHVLVSTRRIVPDAFPFQGLNIVGAALLSVASLHGGALPSSCVNLVWILFGIRSLAGQRRCHAAALRDVAGREAVRRVELALVNVVVVAA